LANDIGTDALRELSLLAEDLDNTLSSVTGTTKTFAKILAGVASRSKDIPENITNANDFLKEMSKNADLFKKIQEQTANVAMKGIEKSWLKIESSMMRANKTVGEIEKSIEYQEYLQQKNEMGKKLEQNFNKMKETVDVSEKQRVVLSNVKTIMDDIGGAIRNPAAAASGMLMSMGELPQKLVDAKEATGGWGGALKKVAGDSKVGGFLKTFTKGGLLLGGLALVTIAFTGLFMIFKNYWDFLDKKVTPATADFNKELGATNDGAGKLKGQVISAGVEMEKLGYSFSEGAKLVTSYATALKTVKLDPKTLQTGKELQMILGLTGEEAGALSLQFMKAEGSIKGLNEMMSAGEQEAKAWGLPVNVVMKDMASAPEVMARFGVANRKEFASATAAAQSYGVSIKDIDQAFGKQMDTFDGTAKAAASLNTIFGTNINSMDLMLETNPVKRLQMLRGELEKQGASWELISKAEQNVIIDQLGVSRSQAALYLSNKKNRRELEAAHKAKEKEIDVNKRWNKGLGSIKTTFLAWQPIVDEVMRSVAKLLTKVLGFDSTDEPFIALADAAREAAKSFKEWIDGSALEDIYAMQNVLITTKDIVVDLWGVLKLGAAIIVDVIITPFKMAYKTITAMIKSVKSVISLVKDFSTMSIGEALSKFGSSMVDNTVEALTGYGFATTGAWNDLTGKKKAGPVQVNNKKSSIDSHKPFADRIGKKLPQTTEAWGNTGDINVSFDFNLDSKKLSKQFVTIARGGR